MQKYRDMKLRKRANVKMIRNLVFFLLIIIFTFWYIFKDQDLNELIDVIKNSNKIFLFIGFIIMFLSYLIEAINIRSVLISLNEKNVSLFSTFKYTSIGAFFSAITPGSTGGQPIEVYYMTKDNIKPTNGTVALLIELCGFQISTLCLSIIGVCINSSLLAGGITWLYVIGIVINICALSFLLLGLFSTTMTKKFINLIIKIMKKAKVKNFEIKKQKLEDGLINYANSSKYIKDNKKVFIMGVLRVFMQMILCHSVPYFIYLSFGMKEMSFFEIFARQAILYTTVKGLPIPGAVGASETLFMKLFSDVFGKSMLGGAMLLYRFVSFYLYVIIFMIIVMINATKEKNINSVIDKDVKEVERDYSSPKLSYEGL